MSRRYLFFVVALMGMISSCSHKKSLSEGTAADKLIPKDHNEVRIDKLLQDTQVPYTWFAGKGQGQIDWDGSRYSVRFNVRILHDSIIWMQISKFGFEVGRMLVRPDSAFFINRLEHTYSAYNTAEFLKQYNVPADFDLFSRVFTAGAYIPSTAMDINRQDDGSIVIFGGQGMKARYWFDARTLSRSMITDSTAHEWTAGFNSYRPTNSGQYFPYTRTNSLVLDGQANVFDLDYNEVVIDVPQEFPFSIPSHYEKE